MSSKKSKLQIVVLCGGKGERLWPYSRLDKPKQFLPISGSQSLISHTIDRCKKITDNILVVTSQDQEKHFSDFNNVIFEPKGMNTAAAILLATLGLQEDDIITVLPADHFIPDHDAFISAINKSYDYVSKNDKICILGLKPTSPATGYGYIEAVSNGEIAKVFRFHEKPNAKVAKQYIIDGDKYWNLGVFSAKASVFINEFKTHAPMIYDGVYQYHQTGEVNHYLNVHKTSFDYAIMEKSNNVVMLPVSFQWTDVGNIASFLSIQNTSRALEVNSENNLVDVKDKLVALVGVNDLCIVDQDDVLVIAKRSDVESMRDVVALLKEQGKEKFC